MYITRKTFVEYDALVRIGFRRPDLLDYLAYEYRDVPQLRSRERIEQFFREKGYNAVTHWEDFRLGLMHVRFWRSLGGTKP